MRYFVWNFKGTLWNSTQNILPIHWKIWFLYNIEILRALRFKSSYAFLKRPPDHDAAHVVRVETRATLKRKCRHFDEILITGCTGSCHFDNFQCSQWWKFHQNEDISVSVNIKVLSILIFHATVTHICVQDLDYEFRYIYIYIYTYIYTYIFKKCLPLIVFICPLWIIYLSHESSE